MVLVNVALFRSRAIRFTGQRTRDLTHIVLKPAIQSINLQPQGSATFRQFVLDMRRNRLHIISGNKGHVFKLPQRLRQHLLGNALNHPKQLSVPTPFVRKRVDNQQRPLIRDLPKQEPRRAFLNENAGWFFLSCAHAHSTEYIVTNRCVLYKR